MSAQPRVAGIDAGGTSTRCWVRDLASGEIVFRGQSGPANLTSSPSEVVARSLDRATAGAPPVAAVFGGFAGLVSAEARQIATAHLERRFPGSRVGVDADYAVAFHAADGLDALVIAGTGSIIVSPGEDGWHRSGGGGYLLGDDASGFRLGQLGLRWALRQEALPPAFATTAMELFGTAEPQEIVRAVHAAPSPAALLARFCPTALAARADVPELAEEIRIEFSRLARTLLAHLERHPADSNAPAVGLAGGVWSYGGTQEIFRREFEALASPLTPVIAKLGRPPVEGALVLAEKLLQDR